MALRVAVRTLRQKLGGAALFCRGAALQARMLIAVLRRGIDIRNLAAVRRLIEQDGRIAGVEIETPSGARRVAARRGVLIASGGFAHNAHIRQRFQRHPTGTVWTLANPGDTGDLIEEAARHGAARQHMAEAWWQPISLKANGAIAGFHSPQELQKPYGIAVNARGERFVNEAASYMEIGQAMYREGAVPAWIVVDARHRRFYPWGAVPPRVMPRSWLKSGYMKRAQTLRELAGLCGIDPDGLEASVARFNRFAHAGLDEDFGRGNREYDKLFADPRVKPNAALGALEQAPFYAVEIVPGDVGTAGGLAADEHGRVLRDNGSAIEGLYVCGNSAAPAFGRWYPGPGASIASSFVFGYVSAQHAAYPSEVSDNDRRSTGPAGEHRRSLGIAVPQ